MTRKPALAAWFGAAALIVASCAGGGVTPAPPTPGGQAPTNAPASAPTVTEAPAATEEPAPPSKAASTCEAIDGDGATTADIAGFAYPAGLSVTAGEAITWTNRDRAPHTVTFDDGSCSSGSIGAGASRTVRYDVAGTYPFHCAIHPNMTGSLEVKG